MVITCLWRYAFGNPRSFLTNCIDSTFTKTLSISIFLMCSPILNEKHQGWLLRLCLFHLMHKPRESRHGQVTKRIQNVPASSSTKPSGLSLKPTEEANLETKCWCSPFTAKAEKNVNTLSKYHSATVCTALMGVFFNKCREKMGA